MTLDLPVLVAVRRRVERMALALALNPDHPRGDEIESRVMRVMNWMGATGRTLTRPYAIDMALDPEPHSPLRFKRGGLDHYAETGAKVIPLRRRG